MDYLNILVTVVTITIITRLFRALKKQKSKDW